MAQRGFVLLIVLAVLVTMSVIVTVQAQAGVSQRIAAVRINEEAAARAIAETCLKSAETEVRNAIANGIVDFDVILDPDGTPGNADDYVPSTGAEVFVPRGVTAGSAEPLRGLHRYKLLRQNGGGCLVRYDDNADDRMNSSLLANMTSNHPPGTPVDEGPAAPNNGTNLNHRDRDLAIYATAIGLYPVHAGTADADAYHLAHARVTVRRYLISEAGSGFTPTGVIGVHGGSQGVNQSGSGTAVCGGGGVDTSSGSVPNGICACGEIKNSGPSVCATPSPCATCAPQSVNSSGTSPGVTTKSFGSWIPAEAFRGGAGNDDPAAEAPLTPIGNNICDFYFDDRGAGPHMAYYWDHSDTDPDINLLALADVSSVTVSVTGEDCSNYTALAGDRVGPPCTWIDVGATWTVTCTATQSACWKPAAVLEVGGGSTGAAIASTTETTFVQNSEESFRFDESVSVPFVNLTAPNDTWGDLCGTSASGAPGNGWAVISGKWQNDASIDADEWPTRGVNWIFDQLNDSQGEAVYVGAALGANGDPLTAMIVANGSVESAAHYHVCCPRCNCASAGSIDCTGATDEDKDTGYSVYAAGHCYVDRWHGTIGDMLCKTVQVKDESHCFVGDITGTTACNSLTCGSGANVFNEQCDGNTSDEDPGVCIHSNADIVGNVTANGDVIITDSVTIRGVVGATDDLYFNDNNVVTGSVAANQGVYFNGADTVVDNIGGVGPVQSLGTNVQFQEAPW